MPFISRGIGGGGSLFGPSIDPSDPDTIFVVCDMSQVFYSANGGATWSTLPWGQIQGKPSSQVQFSMDGKALYMCDITVGEGGKATARPKICYRKDVNQPFDLALWSPLDWSDVPAPGSPQVLGGTPNIMFADPTRAHHLLVCNGSRLYSVEWADPQQVVNNLTPFIPAYPAGQAFNPQRRLAGAFFDASLILAATDSEILHWDPAATSFSPLSSFPPANTQIISFSGANIGGQLRFYAIVTSLPVSSTSVPGTFIPKGGLPANVLYWGLWDSATKTIGWTKYNAPAGYPPLPPALQHVAATSSDARVYVAAQLGGCTLYRIDDIVLASGIRLIFGPSLTNALTATGWGGEAGPRNAPPSAPAEQATAYSPAAPGIKPDPGQASFLAFSSPTGLSVVIDPDDVASNTPAALCKVHVVITDTAFIHRAVDDGLAASQDPNWRPSWQQIYLRLDGAHGSNLADTLISPTKYYEGSGLQATVCTWIDARIQKQGDLTRRILRTSSNDVASTVSKDGGATWSFAGEVWDTDPYYENDPNVSKRVFLGDISQTVCYVDDSGQLHEFAIRHHLDPGLSMPYGSIETTLQDSYTTWAGGLHKLVGGSPLAFPIHRIGLEQHAQYKLVNPAESEQPLLAGLVWRNLKANFGYADPGGQKGGVPTWMAVDPDEKRLYVAVASDMTNNPEGGGVWYCEDEIPKIHFGSQWKRIPNTGPFPNNIRILQSGRLLVSQSANLKDLTALGTTYEDQQTSGVAVYQRHLDLSEGESWTSINVLTGKPLATSDAGMKSWTQDVVLDPSSPKDTWFACVWSMDTPGLTRYAPDAYAAGLPPEATGLPSGGIYKTDNAGQDWSPIFPAIGLASNAGVGLSVTSCTVHPDPSKSREMYICTRFSGLYRCANIDTDIKADGTLDAVPVAEYPFRAPIRIFYVPIDEARTDYEVWVTSNGHGIHLLPFAVAAAKLGLGSGIWARIDGGGRVDQTAGDSLTFDAAELRAAVERVMLEVAPHLRHSDSGNRLREAIRAQLRARILASTRSGRRTP